MYSGAVHITFANRLRFYDEVDRDLRQIKIVHGGVKD